MDETKKNYEAIVIVSCKNTGDNVTAILGKLKRLVEDNAELKSFDEWGKRKLAYPIEKETEGYYALFNFISEGKFPKEFVRICRITDGIVRVMVVKCSVKKKRVEKKKPVEEREEAFEPESSGNSKAEGNVEVEASVPETVPE